MDAAERQTLRRLNGGAHVQPDVLLLDTDLGDRFAIGLDRVHATVVTQLHFEAVEQPNVKGLRCLGLRIHDAPLRQCLQGRQHGY